MPDSPYSKSVNATGSLIQSPELNESNKPTQSSIRDVDMARDIIKTVIAANRNRQIVNSRILAKYNAERPYNVHKMEQEGQGWRQNFTTKPLPLMIEKVAPRFVRAVDGLKYLTNASLSSKWQNATEKTEKFRKTITDVIRARKGWKTLVEDIAFDNGLFGHTIPAWLDEFKWFPHHFKQDESFVADGTKSDVQWAQIIVLKETYLPHELFEYIDKDGASAATAGWNVPNVREVINKASPAQIRDRMNVGGTLETWYQNAIRELTLGASYMAGASVIVVYTLLAREVTGEVSHYRLGGPEMIPLFERKNRFKSMADCATFFSFQKGNGTLHGSKGIGRDIYELAGMLDRTRNEVVDRLILSGKTLIQGDPKRIHTFKMSVVGSTVIIPNNWTVLEQKIDGNVEGFLKLDAYFSMLVDQLIGNVSPPPLETGENFRSPVAWNLLAEREEETKDYRIVRFLGQFVDMVGTMQKRICDPDIDDEDAKQAQKQLLEVMSREELTELANQPVAGTVQDLTPLQRQVVSMVCQQKRGHPLYNQRALEVEDVTALVGSEFADKVILPGEDPTQEAEQNRFQNLELMLLSHGQPVPVSPRDAHLIHLKVLLPAAEQIGQQIASGQFSTDVLESVIAHVSEHYAQAQAQRTKDPFLDQVGEFLRTAGDTIAQLRQVDAQAQQLQAQNQPQQPPTA